ncbi:NYN domain-containing protein [Rubrobacter indicoceani]|uniref:NYN domain-containing protein n=1 Tax=Rubrobacter indicoceani TaxID=2051957 RepID=UPI000E5A7252|nr:NYN domain-containing protein [Rubrobacter indicoceani]
MAERSYMIFDGYNVIGGTERYRTNSTGSLDDSRELFISDCLKAAGWTGAEIFIVFDARGPSENHEIRAGGAARIIYSPSGQSADDVIERLLAHLTGNKTVYSADFALQRTALARGAKRATPGEFQALLNELPAVTRNPNKRARSRIVDRLSRETLESLEDVRRRAGEREE